MHLHAPMGHTGPLDVRVQGAVFGTNLDMEPKVAGPPQHQGPDTASNNM